MTRQAHPSPLQFLIVAALRQIARRPYLSASVVVHAALLALLYYFGSYQPELREREAEVASSLRATSVASTAKRLQDLETIKHLLEKSADPVDAPPEPTPDSSAPPKTPAEMVERARELSQAIDTLDKKIQEDELAKLGVPKPPPVNQQPQKIEVKAKERLADAGNANGSTQATVTPEQAANEVARLESNARTTLAKRQQRLDARANGVPVEGSEHGSGAKSAGGNAAVRSEIAEFIRAGQSADQSTQSTKYADQNFFDGGNSEIPPVDVANLVLGRGRMFGAGGEYANRVYLNSWYIIGPFAGRHGADLFDNPSYPPEKAVLLDAVYYGKDKRLLQWRYVTSQSYPFYPPDETEDSVYYGYTEVSVDQACDLTAWIGVDDDVQIYLNDQLVWKGGNVNKGSYFNTIFNTSNTYLRDYNRTEGKRVLHFNKGRNKIFFKLSNGPNLGFLSMVLTR